MNAHDAICKAAHDALCKIRTPHAAHVWFSPVPYFDYVADTIEAAVSAAGYTITLTDDGAGSGEPAVAAGEAGSIPAGNPAPSSPHPTREQVAELLSNATRNLDYKQWETPHGMLPFADALLAAGLFGEGATPATFRAIHEAAVSLQTAEQIATLIEEYADDLEPPITRDWLVMREWGKDLLHDLAARAREIGGAS